jgi:tellurite resistance protein TerC
MGIGTWTWVITLVVLVGVLLADLLIIGRRPHEPSPREAGAWVAAYMGLAIAFGIGLWIFSSADYAGQFFAGWLTEYSLSLDNLFVFVLIMSRFAVPRAIQQKTLMIGIITALVLRGIFIAAGAALISRFDWVFFIFGGFLIYTSVKLFRGHDDEPQEEEFAENALLRTIRRVFKTADHYDQHGHFRIATPQGRKLSPLVVVVVAIGTTDLVFALDSIPAIFGLTTHAYIVFTANVFALMGLRQFYFLLGAWLRKLKYLSYGLSLVLGFIGLKLVLEALHGNNLSFINHGQPVSWAPEFPIWVSLLVITVTIGGTMLASVVDVGGDDRMSRLLRRLSRERAARAGVVSKGRGGKGRRGKGDGGKGRRGKGDGGEGGGGKGGGGEAARGKPKGSGPTDSARAGSQAGAGSSSGGPSDGAR